MLYIIDKNRFKGCIEASMPDRLRTKYSRLTFNQYKESKNNPNLITVTVEEFERMRDRYIKTLVTPLVEISENEYYGAFKKEKLSKASLDKAFACFFLGEFHAFGIYDCYCDLDGKYYSGRKSNTITCSELEEELKLLNQNTMPGKKIIVTEYNHTSECIELYNYLQKYKIEDVIELFDQDTCKMRIGGYDYYYIKIEYEGIIMVVYVDVQYEIERKELETILFLFFSQDFEKHFTRRFSLWSEYTEAL